MGDTKTKAEVNARQIRTHLTWNQQNQKGNMTVAELCQTWNCWKNSHFVILFHPKTRKIPDAMDYWIFVSDPDRLVGTGVHS